MSTVTYHVSLRQSDGGPVIRNHEVQVFRKRQKNETEVESEIVISWACLHPDRPEGDLPFVFQVLDHASDKDWTYVLELRGPAHLERPEVVNYYTSQTLPRRTSGQLRFVMPVMTLDDLHDDAVTLCHEAPQEPIPPGEDPPDEAMRDLRPDFAEAVLLEPLHVFVRAVSAKTRLHLDGYSSRLAIHGYAFWTKCMPLTHGNVGYGFRVRRTSAPVWVTLNKTGGGEVVASARLNIGRGGPAQVVFVLPDG